MRLVLLSVLCCTYAVVQGQSGNADAYLDQVLENARNDPAIRSQIDPLVLDDIPFDKGQATNIRIFGLTSLGRKGPATLKFQGSKIVIEADIGLDGVFLDARYKYRVGKLLKFSGRIGAKVQSIHCYIKLTIQGVRAHLEEFNVVALSGVKVTNFSGASVVFNWLAKWIANIVIDKSSGKITRTIETESRQAIATALEKADIHNFLPK